MSNSDITDRADSMKSRCALEHREMPQDLGQGCLECAADVLSKVLNLSSPVPVPEELVQAAIRVFPVPPPRVKPSSAPALPVLAPRLTYTLEAAGPKAHSVNPIDGNELGEARLEDATDSTDAVVLTVGIPSKR